MYILNQILFKKNFVRLTNRYSNSSFADVRGYGYSGKKMRLNSKFILIIISLAFFSSFGGYVNAQASSDVYYVASPSSRLWIDGTSNVDSFTCRTQTVNGYADIDDVPAAGQASGDNDKVAVSVSVRSLDCGNGLMNNDMYDAMKADKFPFIKYELMSAHLSSRPDSAGGWFTLDTKGSLYIAGVKNTVDIKMKVKRLADSSYRLVGSKQLSMRDFGIIPPSHFFGLIRANDKLVVHFDLIAEQVGSLQNAMQNIQPLLAK